MSKLHENALNIIERAANTAVINKNFLAEFMQPQHSHLVSLPIKMDDGRSACFTGIRVQHNNLAGPYKGG